MREVGGRRVRVRVGGRGGGERGQKGGCEGVFDLGVWV